MTCTAAYGVSSSLPTSAQQQRATARVRVIELLGGALYAAADADLKATLQGWAGAEGSGGGGGETPSRSQSSEASEQKRKAVRQKKSRDKAAQVMARFSKMQRSFIEKGDGQAPMDQGDDASGGEATRAGTTPADADTAPSFSCISCQEDVSMAVSEQGYVLFAFLQRSAQARHTHRGQPPRPASVAVADADESRATSGMVSDEEGLDVSQTLFGAGTTAMSDRSEPVASGGPVALDFSAPAVLDGAQGVFVSMCGHGMHVGCWRRFFLSNFGGRSLGGHMSHIWEFSCPLCQFLCNTGIPVFAPSSEVACDGLPFVSLGKDAASVAQGQISPQLGGDERYIREQVDAVADRHAVKAVVASLDGRRMGPPDRLDIPEDYIRQRLPAVRGVGLVAVSRATWMALGRLHKLASEAPAQSDLGVVNAADAIAFSVMGTVATVEWDENALGAHPTIRTLPHLLGFGEVAAHLPEAGIGHVSGMLKEGAPQSDLHNTPLHAQFRGVAAGGGSLRCRLLSRFLLEHAADPASPHPSPPHPITK